MSRSLKKGPYINVALEKKILAMNESGKKTVVKTWARASMISPDFVGHTVAVHNGNKFIPVYILRTWWVTSLVSFHRPVVSAAMPAIRSNEQANHLKIKK